MKFIDILEDCKGKNNNNWKGKNAKERAKHLRRGKAKKCSKCGSTRFVEWAESPPGSDKYRALCKSCHSKYDEKEKNFKK